MELSRSPVSVIWCTVVLKLWVFKKVFFLCLTVANKSSMFNDQHCFCEWCLPKCRWGISPAPDSLQCKAASMCQWMSEHKESSARLCALARLKSCSESIKQSDPRGTYSLILNKWSVSNKAKQNVPGVNAPWISSLGGIQISEACNIQEKTDGI